MSSDRRLPSVSIKTIGCRLNQAESAAMAAGFNAAGYHVASPGAPANVCVVHTCAVTANAERKSMQFARSVKRKHPDIFVVLAGCAVELSGPALAEKTGADLLVGQADKFRLPTLIAAHSGITFLTPPTHSHTHTPTHPIPLFNSTRALVKVQDGCNFHCSYCVVPRARGNPVSRPLADVVKEVEGLVENGYREVVLTGANLGCYRHGNAGLVDLVQAVERIRGLPRIRLSSLETTTAEHAVVEHMGASPKLCRYLHIPLQSGSDTILASMGRRYTVDDYYRFVSFALERVPGLGLGTDLIVGFPGENDSNFDETVQLVKRIPFSNLHVFTYSKRDRTPAATMRGQVPDKVKKIRAARLAELGAAKSEAFGDSLVGTRVSVLVEEHDSNGQAAGWTGEYVRAVLPGGRLARNDIVDFVPDAFADGMLRTDTAAPGPQKVL